MENQKKSIRSMPLKRYFELVNEFPLRPIRSKAQLHAATAILDQLFGHQEDQGVVDYVETLAVLVNEYEQEHDPNHTSNASGIEVLRSLMELRGMTQASLAGRLGISPGAMSLILSGERSLTIRNMRKLAEIFYVEPGVFV
jgi:HTH-type transcriptional regulator/antitoxin HigA